MYKRLFIPGLVDVRPDILQQMSRPIIAHRSKEASLLQKNISNNLRRLFFTESEILLSTTSGSGLMEGAIKSCTKKRVAVFSSGAFGKRWFDMALSNNVPAELFEVEEGQAISEEMVDEALKTGKFDAIAITHNETSTGVTNPIEKIGDVVKKYKDIIFIVDAVSSAGGTLIEVDKWGIDICITSTQKCLGLPPGMSICTFSEKAKIRAEKVGNRGFYLDLLSLYNYIKDKDYQYPSTPSISHMYALDYQLDYILNKEGINNRFDRHESMANVVRNWGIKYFELFSNENYLSNTVTTIKNTRGISISDLNYDLGKRGFEISNGYGNLKEKTFRIAHMADCTISDLNELFLNINEILGLV